MISSLRLILFTSIFILSQKVYAQQILESPLIFEDYFESFNKNHWKKASHTFENNLAQFSGKNFSTKNGRLQLHLKAVPTKGKLYSAAEIRTRNSFRYGKFVARLKPATGEGIVSGFFLYDSKGRVHNEIDIEFTDRDTKQIHFNRWINQAESPFSLSLNFDTGNTYHEYSILWLPDYICWEIDGKEVYKTNVHVPHSKMRLMFNIWASKTNSWAGRLETSRLPASMEIDYVKIFSYR